ncbi:MAG: hypothetical protein AB4041_08380 [Microcystaceae cyanobacterium]
MTVTQEKLSWYDVSPEVKDLLILASDHWENAELSEQYLKQAIDKANNNLDVLVGAYRYFFYKSKANIALEMANKVLSIIQVQEQLPTDWDSLQPILTNRQEEPMIRLYLNAYAATGYLFAKMGQLDQAKCVTERVKTIDKNRESCATTVFEVLTNPEDDEDD